MADRRISMGTWSMRQYLAGRKTMTRRLVKRLKMHPDFGEPVWDEAWVDGSCLKVPYRGGEAGETVQRHYGRYDVGDRLIFCEKWRVGAWSEYGTICVDYEASGPRKDWIDIYPDGKDPDGDKFNNLIIQCGEDAKKTGLSPNKNGDYHWEPGQSPCRWRSPRFMPTTIARPNRPKVLEVRAERLQEITVEDCLAEGCTPSLSGQNIVYEYRDIWNSIHGPGAWAKNEWVWVYTFEGKEAIDG